MLVRRQLLHRLKVHVNGHVHLVHFTRTTDYMPVLVHAGPFKEPTINGIGRHSHYALAFGLVEE